jgi:hypothetical protein
MVAGTTTRESFEKAIDIAAQGKGKVYVDLKSGTFSTDKTQGAVKVPLAVLQGTYQELMQHQGFSSEQILKSKTWQLLPQAASQKKGNMTDIFKSTQSQQKAEVKNQGALREKLAQQAWDLPVHFVGAVGHSKMQHVGEDGKSLDANSYRHEMYSINNKVLVTDKDGKPILDDKGHQQFKTIPGLPSEIHVYQNVLDKTYKEWEGQLNSPNAVPRFDLYVQKKLLDRTDLRFVATIRKNNVRYLNDADLSKTKLTIEKNGDLKQVGLTSTSDKPGPITRDGNDYAFVLGKNNAVLNDKSRAIYMTPKTQTDQGMINHSSFFRGGKVESAGMITMDKGKIAMIEPLSGHYKPGDAEIAASLRYFRDNLPANDFNAIVFRPKDGSDDVKAHIWLENFERPQKAPEVIEKN